MKYYKQKPQIVFIAKNENGDIFRLVNRMKYLWHDKILKVPAGFESDGASVPCFLWASISPKIDDRTLAGSIAHDFIYRTQPADWTRKEADDMFYDIIREDGLSWIRAQKAYWGVRLFGGIAWKNNQAKLSEVAK